MISEDYDHRWEPLVEAHFSYEDQITDENYIYCLCSRVVVRYDNRFNCKIIFNYLIRPKETMLFIF